MTVAAEVRDLVADALPIDSGGESLTREDRAALLLYLVLSRLGALVPGAAVAATSLAWYDELRLAPAVAAGLRSSGLDGTAASAVAGTVRSLLALPRPSGLRGRGPKRELRLLERWLASEPIREAMGVNVADGEEWLDRDRFAALLIWAQRLDKIEGSAPADPRLTARLLAAAEATGYRVDRLRAALSESPPAEQTRSTSRRASRPRGES
jgi:hypothetical protein